MKRLPFKWYHWLIFWFNINIKTWKKVNELVIAQPSIFSFLISNLNLPSYPETNVKEKQPIMSAINGIITSSMTPEKAKDNSVIKNHIYNNCISHQQPVQITSKYRKVWPRDPWARSIKIKNQDWKESIMRCIIIYMEEGKLHKLHKK